MPDATFVWSLINPLLHSTKADNGAHLGNRHYTDICHTDELKKVDWQWSSGVLCLLAARRLASGSLAYRLLDARLTTFFDGGGLPTRVRTAIASASLADCRQSASSTPAL
jgi:hypothetical protein